jgi:hypothetical protein
MRWIIYLTRYVTVVKKSRIWPLPLVPLCAGDGESTGTGAAKVSGSLPPDLNRVRTRRDLAKVINEAADPLLVKQEILDEQAQAEPMEYDNEENFLEFIGPDRDEADQSMEDDEALLDEGDEDDEEGEEMVVGEDDDAEGSEYDDGRNEVGAAQEGVGATGDAGVEGEVSPAAAAADAEEADVADPVADPEAGRVVAAEAIEGVQETDGGHGGQDGEEDPGQAGGNGLDGSAGGLSDGDFDEEDLVLEGEGEDELDSKLKPDHKFFAVRTLVEGGKTARKLNRRLKVPASTDDGFLVKGDERYFRNFNESSIERRVNVSVSFQYNGTCHTCLNGPHDAWQGRDGQPVVMVAGDHHFPANIPAREDGECIRILRVENGSLAEITGELVRLSPRGGGRYQAW